MRTLRSKISVLAAVLVVAGLIPGLPGSAAEERWQPAGEGLFGSAPAGAPAPPERMPWELRQRVAAVRWDLLRPLCSPTGPAGYPDLTLNLFPGTTVTAGSVTVGRTDRADSIRWSGEIRGLPGSSVTLTAIALCSRKPGRLSLAGSASFSGQEFTVRPHGDGLALISEIDSTAAGLLQRPARPPKKPRATNEPPPQPLRAGAGASVIDALILYTPGAVKQAGGKDQIEAWITDAATRANDSLRNSRVNAKIRVLDMRLAKGYRGGETVQPAFRHLTKPRDGHLDDVPKLRDRIGADIVTTVVARYDPKDMVGGLASYAERPRNPATSGDVWSVVAANQLWAQILAHEWGHLFGLDHDWTTSPERNRSFPDNHGHVAPNGEFVTIMGYPSACAPHPCPYTGYFAAPSLKLKGQPLGVRLGAGKRPADNTRVMNITAPQLAAYRRPQKDRPGNRLAVTVSPPDAGTVNPDTPAPYEQGDTVTVTADPAPGYRFAGWTLDGKDAGRSISLSITMNAERKLMARFVRGSRPEYRVTTSASPADAGLVTLNPQGKTFPEGTRLLATATPKKGSVFQGWLLDGRAIGDEAKLAIAVSRAHLLVAKFTRPLTLTARSSPTVGGAVALDRNRAYPSGAHAIARAKPARGYTFRHWLLDRRKVGTNPVVSITITGHLTLTAVFVRKRR